MISLNHWRTHSFNAARGKGIIVRASVSGAGCLLRAVWRSTGSHVDSTFIPRYFYEGLDLNHVLAMGENMLKKPVASGSPESGPMGFDDESFAGSYPLVYSYLCDLSYEDGAARQTATITLFCDEGVLKGSLNDRDNERTLFLTARGLMELLECFEAALGDARTVWKPYRGDFKPKQHGKGRNR